jgi:hypothetical protein
MAGASPNPLRLPSPSEVMSVGWWVLVPFDMVKGYSNGRLKEL